MQKELFGDYINIARKSVDMWKSKAYPCCSSIRLITPTTAKDPKNTSAKEIIDGNTIPKSTSNFRVSRVFGFAHLALSNTSLNVWAELIRAGGARDYCPVQ